MLDFSLGDLMPSGELRENVIDDHRFAHSQVAYSTILGSQLTIIT